MIFWATFLPYAALSIGLGWVFLRWIKRLTLPWILAINTVAIFLVSAAALSGGLVADRLGLVPPSYNDVDMVVFFSMMVVWIIIVLILVFKRAKSLAIPLSIIAHIVTVPILAYLVVMSVYGAAMVAIFIWPPLLSNP